MFIFSALVSVFGLCSVSVFGLCLGSVFVVFGPSDRAFQLLFDVDHAYAEFFRSLSDKKEG